MNRYLRGEALYGENMSRQEIDEWFEDERNGYFQLNRTRNYQYHAKNHYHGFRFLPDVKFENVLGIGSAYGDEFSLILGRLGFVTILEPGEGFHHNGFNYVKPNSDGTIPFADASFDLITCFAVLHHIPNVSSVISEIARVLRPGGFCLLDEPITSMGDWAEPRAGLTKHERGIPLAIFREIIARCGLKISRERLYGCGLTFKMSRFFDPFNHYSSVVVDDILCRLPWRRPYHPTSLWQKLGPACVFYILTAPCAQR